VFIEHLEHPEYPPLVHWVISIFKGRMVSYQSNLAIIAK